MSNNSIDSGYSWLLLAVCYVSVMSLFVTIVGNGVIYIALLDKFNESPAMTSLVAASSCGLLCFAAPLAGVLINKYSCRVAIMSGSVLTTLGLALSTSVPNLECMILTAGVLVGLGASACTSGLGCCIGFYFEKYRHYAMSGYLVLPGISSFIATPFAQFLIEELGLNGMFFVYGSITIHVCVAGALLRPSSIEIKMRRNRNRIYEKTTCFRKYIDLGILGDKGFVLFLASTIAWNFAFSVCLIHLPNYVMVQNGSQSLVNEVMMTFSVGNMFGRLLGVFTVGKWNDASLKLHAFSLGFAGIFTTTFPLYSQTQFGVYLFSIQFGLTMGWANSMMPVISLEFIGVNRMSESFVLVLLFCGIGVIVGPIIAGYLYALNKSYDTSFITSGSILLVGSVCGLLSKFFKKSSNSRSRFGDIHIKGVGETLKQNNLENEEDKTDKNTSSHLYITTSNDSEGKF